MEVFRPEQPEPLIPQEEKAIKWLVGDQPLPNDQLLNKVRNWTKTLADDPETDINTLDFWDNILTKLSHANRPEPSDFDIRR